jgi:hypothetical protein
MASTDKTLANLSAWISLAALAGLVVIPLFFTHEDAPPAPSPPRAKPPPAVNAPAQPSLSPPQGAQASPPTVPAAGAPKTQPGANAPAASPPAANAPSATAPAAPAPEVWTDAEQVAGLRDCLRQLAPLSLEVDLDTPMRHGQCGTPAPLLLRSVGEAEKVVFDPAPEMNCRLAAGVARWIENVLQPIAKGVLKSRIVKIIGASSYACRNIYNSPNLPLSEHATGNAVDVVGFVTADGRTITVKHWWGPTERDIAQAKKKAAEAAAKTASKSDSKTKGDAPDPPTAASSGPASEDAANKAAAAKEKANLHRAGLKPVSEANAATISPPTVVAASMTTEATFLKRLHHGACSVFATVLGPEANEAHRDHFHLDMKERKGGPGVCH